MAAMLLVDGSNGSVSNRRIVDPGKELGSSSRFLHFYQRTCSGSHLFFTKDFTSPIFSSRAHLAQKGHCSNAKAQRGCPLTPLSSLEEGGAED